MTCRLQCNANGTSSFNAVKAVLICGDIQANPEPGKTKPLPKYPCGECYKAARNNQDAILCVGCNKRSHAKCLRMSDTIFQYYLRKADIELFAEDSGDESLNITSDLEVNQALGLQGRTKLQNTMEKSAMEHDHGISEKVKLESLRILSNKD